MGLIKSANAPVALQPFSMKDIENQARIILARAQQQAEKLLAAAQVEAEQLRKQAKEAGHAEGRNEGMAQGREEGRKAGREQAMKEYREKLTAAVTTLTKLTSDLNASRRDLEAAVLKDIIDLAISIAERVTKRQGMLDGQVVVANVSEALKLVMHATDVRLAIHPSQRAVMDEVMPQLKLQWPTLQRVELVEDPGLSPGGCRVYTAQGVVDADLDEQLRRIVAELLPQKQELDGAA